MRTIPRTLPGILSIEQNCEISYLRLSRAGYYSFNILSLHFEHYQNNNSEKNKYVIDRLT